MNPRFSIIVPCCNVGKYIAPLASSLASQSCRDYEVLLVVEDSDDDTLAQCSKAAEGKPNWRIFTQPRSGSPAAPRNTGLEHANGEYALFLDGDDLLAADALCCLSQGIDRANHPDLIHFVARSFNDQGDEDISPATTISNIPPGDDGRVLSGPDATCRLRGDKCFFNAIAYMTVCRMDFLNDHRLRFVPGLVHEDEEWTPRALYLAKSVLLMDKVIILYRQRADSIMHSPNPHRAQALATVLRSLIAFALNQPEVPQQVFHIWQRNWLAPFYDEFFFPKNCNRHPPEERLAAVRTLLDGDGAKNFRRFLRHASRPRRIAGCLLLLCDRKQSHRWLLPAGWYFKYLYYPLAIGLRHKHQ